MKHIKKYHENVNYNSDKIIVIIGIPSGEAIEVESYDMIEALYAEGLVSLESYEGSQHSFYAFDDEDLEEVKKFIS